MGILGYSQFTRAVISRPTEDIFYAFFHAIYFIRKKMMWFILWEWVVRFVKKKRKRNSH